jgi:hypothetical protein
MSVAVAAIIVFHGSARAQNVTSFVNSVATAWERGDVDAITGMSAKQGIAFEVDGTHVGSVSGRQAGAVLRRVFDDARTIRATAATAKLLPGSDVRAYGEIVWERRARGTTQAERINIFVALERTADGWHITEIRVMR